MLKEGEAAVCIFGELVDEVDASVEQSPRSNTARRAIFRQKEVALVPGTLLRSRNYFFQTLSLAFHPEMISRESNERNDCPFPAGSIGYC